MRIILAGIAGGMPRTFLISNFAASPWIDYDSHSRS